MAWDKSVKLNAQIGPLPGGQHVWVLATPGHRVATRASVLTATRANARATARVSTRATARASTPARASTRSAARASICTAAKVITRIAAGAISHIFPFVICPQFFSLGGSILIGYRA
jgi:hypothetical protein